jgi:DNA-binding winged helix-turn-helix (wHTH) protein
VIRPADERSLAEEHACSCVSFLAHGGGEVLGLASDAGELSADEPVESEARPMRRGELQREVALDPNDFVLRIDGKSVTLTRTQFSILAYLIQNDGRWVTTGELIREVLGTHHQPDTSLVRVHVHAIRRRLGNCATWLESDRRRARGYRWRQSEVECDEAKQESS